MKSRILLLILISIQTTFILSGQSLSYNIRLNQEGFLPNAVKYAAVINTQSDSFKVMTSDLGTVVLEGQLLPPAYYPSSGENVSIADLTLLNDTGDYVLVIDDLGKSVPFSIQSDVFADVAKAAIKSYYFNRASIPILSEYAGPMPVPKDIPILSLWCIRLCFSRPAGRYDYFNSGRMV
jgi:endoglucanase